MSATIDFHPPDAELLAYLDGEAELSVAAHIERCPDCRGRAHRLMQQQRHLTDKLYRGTCPSSLELGEFHLGVLQQERKANVARHLAECPHCRHEMTQLHRYMAETPLIPEPGPLGRLGEDIREGIRILFSQLAAPPTGPAMAGAYRGEGNAPAIYRARDARVIIEVEPDRAGADRYTLTGLVTGLESAEDARAHLWLEGEPAGSTGLTELGDIHFAGLAAGTYTLVISSTDAQIHVRGLEIGP